MTARSKAYPNIDLATAIGRIELFNKNFGPVGYHNREKVAVGIGYRSLNGASSRAIGALVHYGLLIRLKNTYALSELSKRILLPQYDGERLDAIRDAVQEPALFKELIQQYEGKELPALLGNILTSPHYGISPKVKDEVVQIFRTSLEYAGLLQGDQIIPIDGVKEIVGDDGLKPLEPNDTAENNTYIPPKDSASVSLKTLPSGIKISFPQTLDFAVLTGEFGEEIKNLEKKAQLILQESNTKSGYDYEPPEEA